MRKPPVVKINIKPEAPVQSADVGESPHVRRKKVKEVQGIKENLLHKMRNDLR
jgi:hypothetical protein